jgi:hypothetical protein
MIPECNGVEGIKVAMGYEDGRVEVWALQDGLDWRSPTDARTGQSSWDRLYEGKKHNEAGMSSFRCRPPELMSSYGNGDQYQPNTRMDSLSRPPTRHIRPDFQQ